MEYDNDNLLCLDECYLNWALKLHYATLHTPMAWVNVRELIELQRGQNNDNKKARSTYSLKAIVEFS